MGKAFEDIADKKFNRLTAVRLDGDTRRACNNPNCIGDYEHEGRCTDGPLPQDFETIVELQAREIPEQSEEVAILERLEGMSGMRKEGAKGEGDQVIESEWKGCYRDGWKGLIVEASFAHPAKYARDLIRRIYEHALDESWLIAGDVVIDPFGGIALGGFDAAMVGAHWIGCELESKFVGLGNENIAEWQHRYGHRAGYGSVRLVQGDSRKLSKVLREAASHEMKYGKSDGQLGAMRDKGFDLSVSSPPWEAGAEGVLRKHKFKRPEEFAAAMSAKDGKNGRHATSPAARLAQMERDKNRTYGDSDGQLGQESGEDFWSAARRIVEQTYKVLAPGAHAIWVVKGFVRKGKYVDFPDQWRQLCEAVGFKTLHWHRAWLIEEGNIQASLLGEPEKNHGVERKSFFRRLAEQKGSPRIDYEVVLCQEK